MKKIEENHPAIFNQLQIEFFDFKQNEEYSLNDIKLDRLFNKININIEKI